MSDIDKFVLQYSVELKDSIQRLERLNDKMSKVEKSGSKAMGNLKTFASGAASELDKMIPGLNAVASAAKGLGGAFAVAATAVSVLGAGIKSVLDLRTQMNQQRSDSLLTGLSMARTEDVTRKLSTQGGGYVSRDQAAEGIRKFFEMANAGYRNPTDLQTRVKLNALGVNPGSIGGQSTAPLQMLSQLATKTQGMDDAHIQGLARATGLDIDWLRSVAKTGASGVSNFGMSAEEVKGYNAGSDDVSKLNKDLQEFNGQMKTLEQTVGERVIPVFNGLLGAINGFFGQVTGSTAKNNPGKRYRQEVTPEGQVITIEDTSPQTQTDKQDEKKKQDAANAADKQRSDEAARGVQYQNSFAQAVQLFAGAVSSFSNAIDVNQAIASWAGEVGKAAGLAGSSNGPIPGTRGAAGGSRGLRNNNPGNIEDGPFAKRQPGYVGSDGRFAIFDTPASGVAAHEELLDQSYFGRGLNTPRAIVGKYAPASENDQGQYLTYLKSQGFDPDKAITDKAGFNAAQLRYESGYGSGKGIGQSRDSLMMNLARNTIAQYIGISPEQLMRGGATKGDVNAALLNSKGGIINNLVGLNNQLKNPMLPAVNHEAILAQIRNQMNGLAFLQKNSQAFIDKAQPGGQVRTPLIPTNMPVNIHIYSNGSPQEIAREVQEQMGQAIQDVLHQVSLQTAEKG